MFKFMGLMSLVTLEVGTLFSCSTTGGTPNQVVFDSEYRLYDDEIGQFVSLELNDNIVFDIPEDLVVEYPSVYTELDYKRINGHTYQLDYWYINGNDSKTKVEFPYTINEDTDYTTSYDKIVAYSYSVIFKAVWKKLN